MAREPSSFQKARTLFNQIQDAFDRHFVIISVILVALNSAAGIFIIRKVPYTEIDWKAYMEEVAGVLEDGEYDYKHLRGGTGPLVYPAGFVYIYSLLYKVTDHGTNILRAQYIFSGLHSLAMALILLIYRSAHADGSSKKFPLWIVGLLFMSRRVMSLFVLRLFNDCIQTLILYVSILAFVRNRWSLGCLLYSLSVSVKMNALLFAPGLAVLLCQARGTGGFILRILGICLTSQISLGLPFLLHAPMSYLSRAFELTREFLYKWSVNGAFLSEEVFLDKKIALGLLVAHLGVLLLFGHLRWTSKESGGLLGLLHLRKTRIAAWIPKLVTAEECRDLKPNHIVTVLFTSNFIGIVFARTLHYQFYMWYAHTIPFLVWGGPLPATLKIALMIVVEIVFNTYPPNAVAATALHIAHGMILVSLWCQSRAKAESIFKSKESEKES